MVYWNGGKCTDPFFCMRNVTKSIHDNLVQHYNYGKEWTVHGSLDSCVGRKNKKIAEI